MRNNKILEICKQLCQMVLILKVIKDGLKLIKYHKIKINCLLIKLQPKVIIKKCKQLMLLINLHIEIILTGRLINILLIEILD
jgi:hypothetical protein